MMRCKTGAWMDGLDSDDQTAYTRYLSEQPRSAAEQHRLFTRAGYAGGLTSTKDHLTGRCCCDR